MIKIVFIAPPFSGHLFPQLYLAKQLEQTYPEKYDIHFVTGAEKKAFIESLGYTVDVLFAEYPQFFSDLTDSEVKISMFKQAFKVSKILEEATEQIQKVLVEQQPDLVCVDFVTYPGVFAVTELNIPWVTTMPTPFAIENLVDGPPAFFHGMMPAVTMFEKIREGVARKSVRLIKKALFFFLYKKFKPYFSSFYDERQLENIYSKQAIIGLGQQSLQFERTWPKHFHFVGYGAINEKKSLDLPFERYKQRILVTFGTMHIKRGIDYFALFVEIAKHFPETLFVLSLGRIEKKEEVRQNNVYEVPFVPYEEYVRYFDVVIHHGGAGIVNCCIRYGKPAIVIPVETDQFDFAARIVFHKIGIKLKTVTEKSIVKAIQDLPNFIAEDNLRMLQQELISYETGKIFDAILTEILDKEQERGK